ncbi:MAG TPA: hypothetical protein PK800_07605 [Syntrophorhabdaceae bacterium]|nr:hypothetical protein [Syntrophorhabdaceae bacterium]
MGSPAKILFLNRKDGVLGENKIENPQKHRKDETENLSEKEAEYIKNKALMTLQKIEAMWEMDHCNAELRDHIHLLKHYLERLF